MDVRDNMVMSPMPMMKVMNTQSELRSLCLLTNAWLFIVSPYTEDKETGTLDVKETFRRKDKLLE